MEIILIYQYCTEITVCIKMESSDTTHYGGIVDKVEIAELTHLIRERHYLYSLVILCIKMKAMNL